MSGLLTRSLTAGLIVMGIAVIGALTPDPVCAASASYKYDSLGRLTQIDYDSGVVVKYDYDAGGNRRAELVAGSGMLSPEAKAALIAAILQLLLSD